MSQFLSASGSIASLGAFQAILSNPVGSGYSLVVKSLILQSDSYGAPRVYIIRASTPTVTPTVWEKLLPHSIPCNVIDEVLHLEPGDDLMLASAFPVYSADQAAPLSYRCSYAQENNLRHKCYHLIADFANLSAQTATVPVGGSWIVESVAYQYSGGLLTNGGFSIAGPQPKPILGWQLPDGGVGITNHLLDRGLPLMPGEAFKITLPAAGFGASDMVAVASVTELPVTSLIGQYATAYYQHSGVPGFETIFTCPAGKTAVVQAAYSALAPSSNTFFAARIPPEPNDYSILLNERPAENTTPNLFPCPIHLEPGGELRVFADTPSGFTVSYMLQP